MRSNIEGLKILKHEETLFHVSYSDTLKNKTMFQKTCKQCGIVFQIVFKTTSYPTVLCSQSCYFKFKRAEANKKHHEQIQSYDKSLTFTNTRF